MKKSTFKSAPIDKNLISLAIFIFGFLFGFMLWNILLGINLFLYWLSFLLLSYLSFFVIYYLAKYCKIKNIFLYDLLTNISIFLAFVFAFGIAYFYIPIPSSTI